MHVDFANAMVEAMDARKITLDNLAEMCDISRASVSNYRSGGQLPEDKTVLLLMQHLNAPHLGYIWLRSNKVGSSLLPDVSMRQLSQSILDLRVEMKHVARIQDDIDEIGRNNEVDKHEITRWQVGMGELRDIIRSAFSLLLVPVDKKKAAPRGG